MVEALEGMGEAVKRRKAREEMGRPLEEMRRAL